jgi:hypothetical protein
MLVQFLWLCSKWNINRPFKKISAKFSLQAFEGRGGSDAGSKEGPQLPPNFAYEYSFQCGLQTLSCAMGGNFTYAWKYNMTELWDDLTPNQMTQAGRMKHKRVRWTPECEASEEKH